MCPVKFDRQFFLKNLTQHPGIYKMLDDQGEIIYIGKAKNLKKRVSSYFRKTNAPIKQQTMVAKIARIEVVITHTEGEALLLESQQIKHHKPRYNICLRDDKSYPYIFISSDHPYPQITFHRGAKQKRGQYFGPYPSVGAVKETLKLLQRVFPVRQCEDSYFNHRSRPCLQYQIKYCSAPCVDLISPSDYAEDLHNSILFLQGKGDLLTDQLIRKMEAASARWEFERAAYFRDQIASLRVILEKHFTLVNQGDVDIIAGQVQAGISCVDVISIRHGQQLGNQLFFPKVIGKVSCSEVIQAFIPQYYLQRPIPGKLMVNQRMPDKCLLEEALSLKSKAIVRIVDEVQDESLKWLQLAELNAENGLLSRLSNQQRMTERYQSLQHLLSCQQRPMRLECFDISHTQGNQTVASCVVFNHDGAVKSAYRRFNIKGITPGDDYAAINQVVYRRFSRLQDSADSLPDIIFIDGGMGQVKQAQKALDELMIKNVMIVGVSKGLDRKSGMEKLVRINQPYAIDVPPRTPALLLIQQMRDEAHRFAINGHRQRRAKAKKQSVLDNITGLGIRRKQLLLKQFGGLQSISDASVDALASIKGISKQLAQRIYDNFHHQDGH